MEKKVLLKKLVESGTHVRSEFTPTAIVSNKGSRPIGEFWDANKTVDVIVNGAHAVHDTVRELDEFTEAQIARLDNVKVGRIGNDGTISDIKALTNAQIDKLKVGDTVIKGEHSYTVAYKSSTEMSLVYSDVWTTEEVYYEKHDGNWAHVVTDSIAPQEKLVSGQNIKTISGQSILGEGNIDIQADITANEQMPAEWIEGSQTMADLIAFINADENAVPGKIYLGSLVLSDLPTGLFKAEIKAEIMGEQAGKKIILFSTTSADISPYMWQYTSYNMSDGPWRSWVSADIIETTDITALTNAQCTKLKAGDVVLKKTGNAIHAYRVSYKEYQVGMCLTYTDASTSETVSYDYTDGHWVYNSTDITNLSDMLSRIQALEATVFPQNNS